MSNCTVLTCQLDVGLVRSSDAGAHWTARVQMAGPMTMTRLPNTSDGYMVGDYISTSYVATSAGDAAVSVFEQALAVTGKTCTLGDNSSCRERTVAHLAQAG